MELAAAQAELVLGCLTNLQSPLPLQLPFKYLLLLISSPFSCSDSWWHKSCQWWWSGWCPGCSCGSMDPESLTGRDVQRHLQRLWAQSEEKLHNHHCMFIRWCHYLLHTWCMRCNRVKHVTSASANPKVRKGLCTAPSPLCMLSLSLVVKPLLGSLQLSFSSLPWQWVGAMDQRAPSQRTTAQLGQVGASCGLVSFQWKIAQKVSFNDALPELHLQRYLPESVGYLCVT